MKSTNVEMFPYAKRLSQVMQGTNLASRQALLKLREGLGLQTWNNVVDLSDVRKEKKMNTLGW